MMEIAFSCQDILKLESLNVEDKIEILEIGRKAMEKQMDNYPNNSASNMLKKFQEQLNELNI